ncbi:MAG: NUDIX domain-containing protein [Oscillospiraceae bacterium]|nr:NUDIX domain-containing protein [Oscillospiraceae bacterium]
MKREKSCGALVYRKDNDKYKLLLVKHRYGGHWCFPKGHVEAGENETETALREVMEETGIQIDLQEGFRHVVEYYPKPNVKKQVVYFLGKAQYEEYTMQEEEIREITWADMDKALYMVTFKNDKHLIREAKKYFASADSIS